MVFAVSGPYTLYVDVRLWPCSAVALPLSMRVALPAVVNMVNVRPKDDGGTHPHPPTKTLFAVAPGRATPTSVPPDTDPQSKKNPTTSPRSALTAVHVPTVMLTANTQLSTTSSP